MQEGLGDDKAESLDDASLEVAQLGSADSASDVFRGDLALDATAEDRLTRRTPIHVWTFVAETTVPVFFDLASREGGDTVLYLYVLEAGGYRYLDGNDDCYSGTLNSCLRTEIEPGEYAVVATSYQYAYWRRRAAFGYHLTAHCGAEDLVFCTMEYNPVCGCDGRTYGNDCMRRSAGVPLDHAGACEEL